MTAAPFYPPRVKPAARPLRFPFNLIKLLGNNLEVIPEQAYREPSSSRRGRRAWPSSPVPSW